MMATVCCVRQSHLNRDNWYYAGVLVESYANGTPAA